jgi:hypothetical protein
MYAGELDKAVSLLHHSASQDITGQVPIRLWGSNHPYRDLWPKKLEAPIFLQIPSRVAAHFGWNLLTQSDLPRKSAVSYDFKDLFDRQKPPTSIPPNLTDRKDNGLEGTVELSSPKPQSSQKQPSSLNSPKDELVLSMINQNPPETILKIETKIDEISYQKESRDPSVRDGRFPIYVVFTTLKGLEKKYGEKTTQILDRAMRKLVTSFRKRLDWGATLVYVDDPGNMAEFGLKPVPFDDPWKLKLALTDLDYALGKRGAKIGAILIVGGPEVVPFHNLPNPTDDLDSFVPSDNPYATRDENYFVPEWPIGRLPDSMGRDPGLLLSSLRSISESYDFQKSKTFHLSSTLLNWLLDFFRRKMIQAQNSFGCTAEAWLKASHDVFSPIGDPKHLVTSPPVVINNRWPLPLSNVAYFNLHGVQDSADWFGQRDARNGGGIDYPIALRPKDVMNNGRSPEIIFSEACFGSHIIGKPIDKALSLKFLASGTKAFIGSTVISYGSVTPPLNAADLLGKAFWDFFKEGNTTGESLRKAKIYLVKEMHRRQGYLDGEDQKTLISFVLYGDPLATSKKIRKRKFATKMPEEIFPPKHIKTICDRIDIPGTSEPIPREVIANVKKIVDQYLPGMRGAKVCLSHEHSECSSSGHTCPTEQLGGKTKYTKNPERRVVTLSKQIMQTNQSHETYARLTLDMEGNMVKLAVSR